MSYLWLLDNGHGIDTAGKRSPVWSDRTQLFEYEFNRSIIERLKIQLDFAGIQYVELVPELTDVSLRNRVHRANHYYGLHNCIFVSIHANAGGGTGWEVYTSRGFTRSDNIATVFYNHADRSFPEMTMRQEWDDGDPDKEADFYVLRHTLMPAILTENFFMDTYDPDCKMLMNEAVRDQIAHAHYSAMFEIEMNGNY
ncbi:N-acetylmuramoyl-L-alanine amidase [Patescibacteria group bacterium]|nr:N-acetylmuramoyl-L-alanine amidase [Patescibacteria group bacterium]